MSSAATAETKQPRGRRSLAAVIIIPVALIGIALVGALAVTASLSARSAARTQLAARAEAIRDMAMAHLSHGPSRGYVASLERGSATASGSVRLVAAAVPARGVSAVDHGPTRVYTYPAGMLGETPALFEVAVPTRGVGATAAHAAVLTLAIGGALLALLLALLYGLLRRHVRRPLLKLVEAVDRIQSGSYNKRVVVAGFGAVRALAAGLERVAGVLAELDAQAATDPLTGVANRRFFHTALATELARAERDATPLALVLLDLDGFKTINDTHGHPFGDGILQTIAARLRATLRATDVLARVGGDEFALLLPGLTGDAALSVVERARAEASGSVGKVELSWCAGVASYPHDARDAPTLLECADAALYCAKAAGAPGAAVYDPDDVSESRRESDRATIEELLELPDAVVPVFQPLLSLSTKRVVGYEALARFPHPPARRPDEWFAIAHRCGLGAALEAYSLRAALRAAGRPPGTYLSFNLSPSSLSADEVLEILPEDLSDIVIEITEEDHSTDPDVLIAQLAPLRARGARIAIDDAGTDYAGLQHVMRMQPDIVKLDRSLVANVDTDAAKAALIDSLVRFARRTGAEVCAEGVETPEELRVLAALDVAYAQGFGLGRPAAPWAAASGWVSDGAALPPTRTGVNGDADLAQVDGTLALNGLADEIVQDVGADEIALVRHVAEEAAVEAVTDQSWLRAGSRLPLSHFSALGRVVSREEVVQLGAGDGERALAEVALLCESGHGAMLVVPVVADGDPVGALVCLSASERRWSGEQTRRARAAANRLAALVVPTPVAD